MTRSNVIVTLALLALVGAVIVPYSPAQDRQGDRDRRAPGPEPIEQMKQMGLMMEFLEMMKEVCFDEGTAAMVAIGDLKDAVRRKPKEIIDDLEAQLKKTKTLGLRNAIRLTLKDLYWGSARFPVSGARPTAAGAYSRRARTAPSVGGRVRSQV